MTQTKNKSIELPALVGAAKDNCLTLIDKLKILHKHEFLGEDNRRELVYQAEEIRILIDLLTMIEEDIGLK